MKLTVCPDLEKLVAAAQEANVSIHDLQFIRDVEEDCITAISIKIEGADDAVGYFSWLLNKENLKREIAA